jgi:hypothetical protein
MREINIPGSKTPNEKQIGPVMKTAHKPQRLPNRGQARSTPIATPKKPPMTAKKMTASTNPTVDTRRSGSTRSQRRKNKKRVTAIEAMGEISPSPMRGRKRSSMIS